MIEHKHLVRFVFNAVFLDVRSSIECSLFILFIYLAVGHSGA